MRQTANEQAFDSVLAELDERNLTPRDARVLLWLAERDSTPDELGDALAGDQLATERSVRHLERRGLVHRRFEADPREPCRLGATVAGLHVLKPLVERMAGTGAADGYSLWQGQAL
jgi:DNA-binding MarR family transcriptional regulator